MQKIPVRIVPALRATHEASAQGGGAERPDGSGRGHEVDGALRAVTAWVLHARGAGAPLTDAAADRARSLVEGDLRAAMARVLEHWEVDGSLVDRALELAEEITRD
jgi:fructuronate reductase